MEVVKRHPLTGEKELDWSPLGEEEKKDSEKKIAVEVLAPGMEIDVTKTAMVSVDSVKNVLSHAFKRKLEKLGIKKIRVKVSDLKRMKIGLKKKADKDSLYGVVHFDGEYSYIHCDSTGKDYGLMEIEGFKEGDKVKFEASGGPAADLAADVKKSGKKIAITDEASNPVNVGDIIATQTGNGLAFCKVVEVDEDQNIAYIEWLQDKTPFQIDPEWGNELMPGQMRIVQKSK
jgi:hypothetical protein